MHKYGIYMNKYSKVYKYVVKFTNVEKVYILVVKLSNVCKTWDLTAQWTKFVSKYKIELICIHNMVNMRFIKQIAENVLKYMIVLISVYLIW